MGDSGSAAAQSSADAATLALSDLPKHVPLDFFVVERVNPQQPIMDKNRGYKIQAVPAIFMLIAPRKKES